MYQQSVKCKKSFKKVKSSLLYYELLFFTVPHSYISITVARLPYTHNQARMIRLLSHHEQQLYRPHHTSSVTFVP